MIMRGGGGDKSRRHRLRVVAGWIIGVGLCLLYNRQTPPFSSSGVGGRTMATNASKIEQPSDVLGTALFLPDQCKQFYDAVEIGTSNFDTLIQRKGPDDTGLSVDALQMYVDQLPNSTCWRTIASAVVGRAEDVPPSGFMRAYFVRPEDIERHGLYDWLRGSNSVGRPHAIAVNALEKKGMSHLLRNASVPVTSMGRLLDDFGVCRAGALKIDVEGLDGELLLGYADWVRDHGGRCYADTIQGEFLGSQSRTPPQDVDAAVVPLGYRTIARKEDWIWRYDSELVVWQPGNVTVR
ncbi:hypothetical protein ACHAWF_004569 [Thalassiosira exigua]